VGRRRARSRSRAWLALSSAVLAMALAVALGLVWVAWDGSGRDGAELVAPTPPPPPPEVLAALAGQAPAPTPEGVRQAIDELVRGAGMGTVSAAVLDAGTGSILYRYEPDRASVPASAIKLVTAAAVLATLGPAHRIPTVAVAGEQPGEVYLVGGGDPTLAIDKGGTYPDAARLEDLADQVREALGDTPIRRVVVDAGLFTGEVHGPWEPTIPGSGFVAPVMALMTDGGRVDPERVRTPAERWTQPDLAAGQAFADLLGGEGISVERGTAPAPPAGAGPPGAGSSGTRPASPAPGSGSAGPAAAPEPGHELGRVLSPPTIRLVEIMLSWSDNVLAESLARHVALARGATASFEGAAAAQTEVLAELGLSLGDSVLADGSGLSRDNRLTATLVTDLLLTALADPELAGMFAGLPVAGWSGTLAERYRTPQPDTGNGAGVVRAKTGTLTGVGSLAGLVVTADGALIVFALLTNHAPFDVPDRLDRIAATLVTCGCSS
jgi:serine-type D-Ala-D-Ala carboxypeptidase/endopeptidase (penicillin-binding protein 4)